MKLIDLYYRVLGTTGLDVMDLNSLKAAVSNCLADLTSRGYKVFVEKKLILDEDDDPENKLEVIKESENLIVLKCPDDIRKVIYLRLFFNQDATVAQRKSLSDPKIQCRYINGEFRSVTDINQAIFYIKNDKIYIEWNTSLRPTVENISFGYYQKLYCPENFPSSPDDANKMEEVEIDIRKEFEDALVLYAAYFYTARYIRDSDKVNLTLSNYKYYVEDIIHEISYEDEFNEEDAVIKLED